MQEPLAHLIERTFSAAERGVIYRVIHGRRHVRRFAADPIPVETLWRILDAAMCVPSVRGQPPWQVILITSSSRRGMITGAVEALYADDTSRRSNRPGHGVTRDGTLARMRQAPLHLVVTYDRGSRSAVGSAPGLESAMDLYHLGVAIQNLWLAACAEGVGIEWVRLADHGPVARLLDLPCGVELIAYLSLGIPQEVHVRPRRAIVGRDGRRRRHTPIYMDTWGQAGEGLTASIFPTDGRIQPE